jgi:peptidoglycan/LPS O-acetylase OafA/YrhL
MELDNLKEAWTALDNRLKRNEELNESIILEMTKRKAKKSVNWFIALEMSSVVVLLLVAPFCIYSAERYGGKLWALDVFMRLVMPAICLVYVPWGVYKLHGLMKFDFAKNVGDNILCINRYNIQVKREMKVVTRFLIPVLVIFAVYIYAIQKATLSLWTFLICAFIATGLFCYWSYKIYHKSLDSILRSLDEIRELKED